MKSHSMITMVQVVSAVLVNLAISGRAAEPAKPDHGPMGNSNPAVFSNFQDLKWQRILPDLGESSPEICVLHVDPKTQATKLMIRAPKAIHIRKHWHSSNETH